MEDITNATHTLDPTRDRRQIILDAAQALIVAEGLEGFRIREVAQRADMHHATLLHYFPNREALISGVIERIARQFDVVPLPGSARDALPPREALHAHFEHVLAQMRLHPDNFVALHELFLRSRRDEAIHKIFAAVDVQWHAYLSTLLQIGIAQAAFRADLDPQSAATLIMNLFKGISLDVPGNIAEAQQVIDQIERWIVVT